MFRLTAGVSICQLKPCVVRIAWAPSHALIFITTFVRQVLGAVAELDKAMTVAKLRGARERKRRQSGWCEGGEPLRERYPEAVRMAKRLYRTNPATDKRRSLRKTLTSSPRRAISTSRSTEARTSPHLQRDQFDDRGAGAGRSAPLKPTPDNDHAPERRVPTLRGVRLWREHAHASQPRLSCCNTAADFGRQTADFHRAWLLTTAYNYPAVGA